MMTRPIRVGVIGVGRQGERHCRVYAGMAGVDFVGVSDLSVERGRQVADRHGVAYSQQRDELLEQVDAVTVATPTFSHLEVVAECLRRGVHVLVEKPLAGAVDEARQLVELARRAPVVVQVGHIERFNPAVLELQSVLEDLAPVIAVNARRLSPFDTSATDTDVLLDLMIHDLDLVMTLFNGELDSVQAYARSVRTSLPDYVVATLAVAGGPVATLTASRVTEHKVRLLEITALGAYIEVDLLGKTVSIYRRMLPEYVTNHQRPLRYRQENVVERIYIPTAEPLMLELQDFIACVRGGRRPKVTVEDGLRAVELAARVREQFRAVGEPVPALVAV
jgi:predicted dehydrogenase